MAENIHINVNGKDHTIVSDPEMPLLYLLRNNLMLNGPKYGCGIERCGSCMVLLNDKAMPSCMISSKEASHYTIRTLDGLGTPDAPHPVAQSFIDAQAAQCGYCLNGMIVSAKALLDKNNNPTDTEIKEALQRVLCRCGTHTRMITAVKSAAAKMRLK